MEFNLFYSRLHAGNFCWVTEYILLLKGGFLQAFTCWLCCCWILGVLLTEPLQYFIARDFQGLWDIWDEACETDDWLPALVLVTGKRVPFESSPGWSTSKSGGSSSCTSGKAFRLLSILGKAVRRSCFALTESAKHGNIRDWRDRTVSVHQSPTVSLLLVGLLLLATCSLRRGSFSNCSWMSAPECEAWLIAPGGVSKDEQSLAQSSRTVKQLVKEVADCHVTFRADCKHLNMVSSEMASLVKSPIGSATGRVFSRDSLAFNVGMFLVNWRR